MKNKALIISISSLVISLITLSLIAVTYGWFARQVTTSGGTVAVGEIVYVQSGAFIDNSVPVVPADDLVGEDFILDNQSTIASQLRFTIQYTKYASIEDVVGSTVTYSGTDDHIDVVFGEGFVYSSGYWYYTNTTYEFTADSGLLTLITALSYNGDFASIDYANKPVTITVTIQVKQADNVTWNDLTNYNFSTGYPNS